ncbi:MAG: hypothetical protein H6581_01085 [Bacteroidia bacterium]|nr:hypothetical protein [Bacteroidia bacterium]
MEIKCTSSFEQQLAKLEKKKSYAGISRLISEYFFTNSFQELLSGVRIHDIPNKPFIKKRLGGKGGFRIYYVADQIKEIIYLLFIHPKTGTLGQANISDEEKVASIHELVAAVKGEKLFWVKFENNSLTFNKEKPDG